MHRPGYEPSVVGVQEHVVDAPVVGVVVAQGQGRLGVHPHVGVAALQPIHDGAHVDCGGTWNNNNNNNE